MHGLRFPKSTSVASLLFSTSEASRPDSKTISSLSISQHFFGTSLPVSQIYSFDITSAFPTQFLWHPFRFPKSIPSILVSSVQHFLFYKSLVPCLVILLKYILMLYFRCPCIVSSFRFSQLQGLSHEN